MLCAIYFIGILYFKRMFESLQPAVLIVQCSVQKLESKDPGLCSCTENNNRQTFTELPANVLGSLCKLYHLLFTTTLEDRSYSSYIIHKKTIQIVMRRAGFKSTLLATKSMLFPLLHMTSCLLAVLTCSRQKYFLGLVFFILRGIERNIL